MHQELNRLKNNKKNINETIYKDINESINYGFINYKNTDDSIISDIFNFLEIKTFHHLECGEKSYMLQSSNIFKINILDFYKIKNFNQFNIFNCIDFEMNRSQNMNCKNLKKEEKIKISSQFYLLPKIFLFVFWIDKENNEDENIKNIQFLLEETINLNKFIYEKNGKAPKYELIASAYKKENKYVNYCKSFENNQWYYFYDDKVEKEKSDKNIYNNMNIPCFLIYKLID